jgi:hypothetical protein
VSDQREPVGSVGEEAAKLLGALQEWARESGSDYANAAAGTATSAASSFGAVNEHIATGGDDCRYCPVCQVISVARGTSPEVKQHLASAASSLMQAVAGVLATHAPPEQPGGERDWGVEKIDLSGDDEWEDD